MNTNTATRFVNKSILYLKKHSPQILTGIGVGGFAATVVLAAKETLESKIEGLRLRHINAGKPLAISAERSEYGQQAKEVLE